MRRSRASITTPDPAALAIVKRYEAELSQQLDVEIVKTAVELDSRTASVRSQETNMGDLVADAIRASTGADESCRIDLMRRDGDADAVREFHHPALL